MIKYGSICSVFEAFSVACTGLDFEPLFFPTLTRSRNDSKVIFRDGVARVIYPEEIELLFGFPVGYTNIFYGGKPASKWKRYAAL